jgi:hypothetical protein
MGKCVKFVLIVSVAFNILLFLGIIILGIAWKWGANSVSDIEELTKIRRHSAMIITSIIEEEMRGFRKRQVDNVISKFRTDYNADENCFHMHPNGIRSRCLGYPQKISPTEICLYYGGVNFLFEEGQFIHFDRDRKCSSGYPMNGEIYNG